MRPERAYLIPRASKAFMPVSIDVEWKMKLYTGPVGRVKEYYDPEREKMKSYDESY